MNEFVRGIKRGFPICLGYIPVSFTFGLIAVKMGFSPLQATDQHGFRRTICRNPAD